MDRDDWVFSIAWTLIFCLVVGFIVVMLYLVIQHATGIDAGYVYKKEYSPPSDYVTYTTVNNGKISTSIPVAHHRDETYSLYVKAQDSQGKQQNNYIEVPGDVWQKVEIGQWFDGKCFCVIPK